MKLALALAALVTLTAPAPGAAATTAAADPWGTGLRYHSVTWKDTEHPRLATYSVDAPRGWALTHPTHSTGRFTDPTGTRTEQLASLTGEYAVRGVLARTVDRLEDAGAEVLWTGVRTTAAGRLGTVVSRQDGRLTRTRVVGYDVQQGGAWRAYFLITVSGRVSDGPGLRAILRRVTPTVFSTP